MLLSCLTSLVILGSSAATETLSLLKVQQPTHPGRDERANFFKISNILAEADGVHVVLAVKEVGNSVMHAVLDIKDKCKWARMTSRLSAEGYMYSSVPLYACEDAARDVNVSLSVTTDFQHDIRNFAHLTFHIQDLSPREYLSSTVEFMQHVSTHFVNTGLKMTCFRNALEMYFFTNEPKSGLFHMAKDLKAGEVFTVNLRRCEDMERYLDNCHI